MSSSVTAYPIPWGRGVLLLEPIPASSQGEGRVLPGQVASLSQGPHWWATWGSVSRSRTLRHAAQPGLWTSDLLIASQPALPAELQSPPLVKIISRFIVTCTKISSAMYRMIVRCPAPEQVQQIDKEESNSGTQTERHEMSFIPCAVTLFIMGFIFYIVFDSGFHAAVLCLLKL